MQKRVFLCNVGVLVTLEQQSAVIASVIIHKFKWYSMTHTHFIFFPFPLRMVFAYLVIIC